MKHDYFDLKNIKLHFVEEGSGSPVILLHGFPDFWYTWRYQIPFLSDTFRVIAPDLRGYNLSDKPEGLESYAMANLVGDIIGIIKSLGSENVSLIGHDWGGAIAYNLAINAPGLVDKLVIINCPHPVSLINAFWSMNLRQLPKSWYVFFFQMKDTPEQVLSRNNYEMLRKILLSSILNKESISEADIGKYVENWSQPGALSASINYYRKNWDIAPMMLIDESQKNALIASFPKITVPSLVIWGELDTALDKSLNFGLEKHFSSSFDLHPIPEAGHWPHLDVPDRVNDLLHSFLA